MKRLITHALAVLFGLSLGLVGSASADDATPTPAFQQSDRPCVNAQDTICIVIGTPRAEGPYEVRFVANNRFCVQYRYGSSPVTRCEDHWPFAHPITGDGMALVKPRPVPNITRPCDDRLDTNCANRHWRAVRFTDTARFCVYRGFTHTVRCEAYWPFRRPVINAARKPV